MLFAHPCFWRPKLCAILSSQNRQKRVFCSFRCCNFNVLSPPKAQKFGVWSARHMTRVFLVRARIFEPQQKKKKRVPHAHFSVGKRQAAFLNGNLWSKESPVDRMCFCCASVYEFGFVPVHARTHLCYLHSPNLIVLSSWTRFTTWVDRLLRINHSFARARTKTYFWNLCSFHFQVSSGQNSTEDMCRREIENRRVPLNASCGERFRKKVLCECGKDDRRFSSSHREAKWVAFLSRPSWLLHSRIVEVFWCWTVCSQKPFHLCRRVLHFWKIIFKPNKKVLQNSANKIILRLFSRKFMDGIINKYRSSSPWHCQFEETEKRPIVHRAFFHIWDQLLDILVTLADKLDL